MSRITIKDIGKLVGVSPSTVSRALHNHPDISAELKLKIQSVATEMNFIPNATAINLRSKKSMIIGLIIPKLSMYFIPSLIEGISNELNKKNYKLMVLSSDESIEKEIQNIKICCDSNVDGILISLTNKTNHLDHFSPAFNHGIPIVLIDKTIHQDQIDEVIIDDFAASKNCAEYLINKNCKNILGIFGDANMSITIDRLKGFEATLAKDKGIQYKIIFAENSEIASEKSLIELTSNKNLDGIFMMSDEIMVGVNKSLYEFEQINKSKTAIKKIAISDGQLPQFMTPNISYLHHSGFELGKLAVAVLYDNFSPNTKTTLKRHYLSTALLEF